MRAARSISIATCGDRGAADPPAGLFSSASHPPAAPHGPSRLTLRRARSCARRRLADGPHHGDELLRGARDQSIGGFGALKSVATAGSPRKNSSRERLRALHAG
jgi:hypothetical protein